MRTRGLAAAGAMLIVAACTTNSAVDTGETASAPTEPQIHGFHVSPPKPVNPYVQQLPRPKNGRDGCSTSVREENGALVIPAVHPAETYCIKLAPLANTTIELPPGVRMQTATSAMMRYLEMQSANTAERDVLLLTSRCVPAAKDEEGKLVPAALHEFFDQQDLPYCPRRVADLTVVLSIGVTQFRLHLNSSSHDTRVLMYERQLEARPTGVPVKPGYAQDLFATAIGDEPIAWTPDDAWSDGTQTVIVWYRPMATLPAMMMGPNGEQRASPRVVNHDGVLALVYPDRVTRFQLQMDDRILKFSEVEPKPFIQPAGS